MTEHLDRAIGAALDAIGALKHDTWTSNEADRTYARALVAELLRDMEDTDNDSYSSGFNTALKQIRRRAGLEGNWIPHLPGDLMPCDGNALVQYKLMDGFTRVTKAENLNWPCTNEAVRIVAWRLTLSQKESLMTDTVAPKEGHYALLRNGVVARPVLEDWPENPPYFDPYVKIYWYQNGTAQPETKSDLDVRLAPLCDIIATISPADMKAAASGELERAAKDAEIAMLKTRIQDIKECWDWWQEDTYDRCSSVVDDAIRQAMKKTSDG